MTLLVCGSRNWRNEAAVVAELAIIEPDIIVHGGCPTGADAMADKWAKVNGKTVERYDAEWDKYGRKAGPIRNQRMLTGSNPDMVLAFGRGKGTDGMVALAESANVLVRRIP